MLEEEKLKLVKLSKNQWHYKLIKFVFGNSLPDPTSLKNLCPYFWIMVAAMILVIPVLPFKLCFYIANLIGVGVDKFLQWDYDRWLKSISAEEATSLYNGCTWELKETKLAKGRYTFEKMIDWLESRGHKDVTRDNCYEIFKENYASSFEVSKQKSAIKRKEEAEATKRYYAKKQKRKERDAKVKAFFKKFEVTLKPFKAVSKLKVDFNNYNSIIKATKRFVGLVITLIVGFIVLMICQVFTVAVIALVQIWNTEFVLGVLKIISLILLGGAIGTAIILPIIHLVSKARDKWIQEKRVPLYAKPFVFLGTCIWELGRYLLYYPLYFIFYTLIWRLILSSLIWGFLKGLGRITLKSIGIFGEYFGSSYTDLCLGVSWEDDNKEE